MSEMQYVKSPNISEKEMQTKLDDLRNNVSQKMNKWADRLVFSTYTPKNIQRFEGESWKEDGKSWIVHNGIKKSVTHLQEARMPWWCPRCNKPMNHRFDRKFYFIRGHCFNCNVEIEGKMRLDGTWEIYEQRLLRENEKSFLRDKIQESLDYIRTFKVPQLHFSDGRWEELASLSDFEDMFKKIAEDVDFMMKRLDFILKEEENEEKKLGTT